MIDSHAHIGKFEDWDFKIEDLYDQMQKVGIRQTVIANLAGNQFNYKHELLNEYSTYEINKMTMERVQECAHAFKMLIWIRPLMDEQIDWIEQMINTYPKAIVGLKVHPYCAKLKLTEKEYIPYIEICKKYQIPLSVHTEEDGYSDVKYIIEAARRYPEVNFVAVHMGLKTDHKEAINGMKEYKNLYGDTTLVGYDSVKEAIETCGEKKIIFGSDAVMMGEESYIKYIEMYRRIKEEYGKEVAENIFHYNCIRVFGGEKRWRED